MEERAMTDDGAAIGHFRADSPSYKALSNLNLLTMKYSISSETDIHTVDPNSTPLRNCLSCILCCPVACLCLHMFQVPNGSMKPGYDGRGNFLFFGPGVHQIASPFYNFSWPNVGKSLSEQNSGSFLLAVLPVLTNHCLLHLPRSQTEFANANIVHGDRCIVTVEEGFIGYCTDRGQPILLPPGMHQWQSSTLKFERLIDLNDPVIKIGPYTLLTVEEGYKAVTQDNGKQVILDGGSVYMLTHRNWVLDKIISTKIQTNELKRNEASSADNVIMLVDATVIWRIADVDTAVRVGAETMGPGGADDSTNNIVKLRSDVLKQAEASLASFIGTINFSDTMAVAAINQRSRDRNPRDGVPTAVATAVAPGESNNNSQEPPQQAEFDLYNNDRLRDAVSHANETTRTYGVEIISINIISAVPKDQHLQTSLAAGAVAAAEALMLETTAQGKSRAMQIEALAKSKEILILAKADADADVVRAEGAKKAADLLSTNAVSVELTKIDRTGQALAAGGNSSFFFGAQPQDVSHLLANSSVVTK